MAGRKDIAKYGKRTQFSKDNQPLRNGRKPKLYTIAKKAYNLSYEEFCSTLKYLYQCTKNELKEIVEAEDTPMWVLNVCRAIHKDTGNGVLYTFKELADRMYGTVKNNSAVDITTNGKGMTAPKIVFAPTPLSDKDMEEIRMIQNGEKSSDNTSVPEAGGSV